MHPLGETKLSYVGSRPYIRGADLLFWFERLRQATPDTAFRIGCIKQFRITREVQFDGTWSMGRHPDAIAKLDFLSEDGTPGHASFNEGSSIITQRDPDIPSLLQHCQMTGDFTGEACLTRPSNFTDLLNGLIEVNKRLHVQTLQTRQIDPAGIRLVYVQDLPVCLADGSDAIDLSIRNMGERHIDGKSYTLCQITSPALPGGIKLCYLF